MMVHVDVLLEESEIRRIESILRATGEATSIAAFVAVGAVHYLENEEALRAAAGKEKAG